MRQLTGLYVCGLGSLAAVLGCGTAEVPGPVLVPVKGVVLMEGQPLADAAVSFVPIQATVGQGGMGFTNEAGEFELTSPVNSQPGCPEGEYKVLIQKMLTPSGAPIPPGKTAADVEARNIIPAKYNRMDDLVHVVSIAPGGKEDLRFPLKRK